MFPLRPLNGTGDDKVAAAERGASATASIHGEKATSRLSADGRLRRSAEAGDHGNGHLSAFSRQWTPFFHQRRVVSAIFCLVVLQIGALIALYIYAAKNGGITFARAKDHMAWKFGPTTILSITMAIWTQVEFRAKQQSCWDILAEKTLTAELLRTEYFSPINPVALARSAKRGHWRVTMTILGTLLLQAAIVVSTGLLERQLVPASVQSDQLYTTWNFSQSPNFTRLISRKVEAVVDVLEGTAKRGMAYPVGTTQVLVYQPVSVGQLPDSVGQTESSITPNLTARAQYFAPAISCDTVLDRFNFSISLKLGQSSSAWDGTGTQPSLGVETNLSRVFWDGNRYDDDSVPGKFWEIVGTAVMHIRAKQWQGSLDFTIPPPLNRTACETRVWAHQSNCGANKNETLNLVPASADAQPAQGCGEAVFMSTIRECRERDRSAANYSLTVLQCEPRDGYGRANIEVPYRNEQVQSLPSISDTESTSARQDSPVLGQHLLGLTFLSLARTKGKYNRLYNLSCNQCLENVIQMAEEGLPSPLQDWTDAETLARGLQQGYSRYAVQFFAISSTLPANTSTSGSVIGQTPRLLVQDLAFQVMCSLLCLVALCCLGLSLTAPGYFASRDPVPLAGAVVILSRSPRLPTILQLVRQHGIHPLRRSEREIWWTPWGAAGSSRWTTIVLVSILLVLLQVTLTISQKNNGLVLLDLNSWAHYYWTYIPTTVVALVSLAVVNTEFSFRAIQPFVTLARGGPRAADGLFTDQVFGMLPSRLWITLSKRQLALASITLSAILAPLATIVVSDLITLSDESPAAENYLLHQLNGFDETRLYNWTSDGAKTAAGTSDDLWTAARAAFAYDSDARPSEFRANGFALPYMALAGENTNSAYNKSVLVTTRAARARHNCTFLDEREAPCYDLTLPEFRGNESLPCMHWDLVIPSFQRGPDGESCPRDSYSPVWGNMLWCHRSSSPDPYVDLNNKSLGVDRAASLENLHLPPRTFMIPAKEIFWGGYIDPTANTAPGKHPTTGYCPTILRYGLHVQGNCAASRMSWAACYPYIEMVDVDVKLAVPDFRIESITPKPITGPPSSPKVLASFGLASALSIFSRGEGVLYTGNAKFSPFNDPWDVPGVRDARQEPEFDEITSRTRPNAVTMEDLQSSDPVVRQMVLEALERVWMRPMSKLLSEMVANSTFKTPLPLNGTLIDHSKRRLIQNETSTRILQGLYALILVCLITGFLFSRNMEKVLPFPPTSVGALAQLLLDSRILGDVAADTDDRGKEIPGRRAGIIPPGAERMSNLELKRSGIFSMPREFALKWWDVPLRNGELGSPGTRRFGIDYDVKEG